MHCNNYFKLFLCASTTFFVNSMSVRHQQVESSISQEVITQSRQLYQESFAVPNYFDPQTIKYDPLFRYAAFEEARAQKLSITSPFGYTFEALFVDRASDKLLVIGQGFHAHKEYLVPFLKLFPDYDLLCFDYQNHRAMIATYMREGRSILDGYFIRPQADVNLAVNAIKNRKKYTSVIGLGMCYSGIIFSGAQAASIERNSQIPYLIN